MTTRAPSTVMSTVRPTGPHLTVAGELDPEGAVRLRGVLDDAVAPGVRLTLDLSRVTQLSLPALAVLVHGYRRLRDSGGVLVLEAVSEPVERLLTVSGLHRVLHLPARPVKHPQPTTLGA
ncbi:MAG: Anti-sigma factor antagonist [Frankiales bacterium]|jgi:anti-anti-sigma factor|nr:Anti-sigma factor antagonist [Frankiales bacterium]